MALIAELKRRNVFRVGVAYAIVAWLLIEVASVLLPTFDAPDWVMKAFSTLVILGFPLTLVIAWAFELTPEGIKREAEVDRETSIRHQTGRKFDFAIIGLLALAVVYFAVDIPIHPGPDDGLTDLVSVVREKSIAVLPFTNRSPNPDDIYFTDGVHDDLLTQLAKIDAFSVISRTSVMEYRDTAKNLKEIARELGVANVMEGAVQRAGNRVRINVQLIDASTDEHLWAEVYDRELTTENLFDIQSEIAQAIAGALQATLTDSELAVIADVPTKNVAAYELYLQARRFSFGRTEVSFDTALELYEEALRLDPEFKLAWIGLASAYMNNYWIFGGNLKDRENARDAIDHARALDPDFPELYMAEGFYWYWGHLDYDQAIIHLNKAIDQMPGNAEAHMWLGWASRRDGQWENAVDSVQESLRLDPRVVASWVGLSGTLGMLERHEEALAAAETARNLEPDNYWAKSAEADQLVRGAGDIDRALTLMVGAQHTGDPASIFSYIDLHVLAKDFDEALEAVDEIADEMEIERSIFRLREYWTAQIQLLAGRNEAAQDAARSGLGRLKALEADIPRDYRYAEAESLFHAILGEPEKVSRLVEEALDSKPTDAVEDGNIRYWLARSLVIAGLHQEAFKQLDVVLSNPGFYRVMNISLDPVFDDVRNAPEFVALMKKYR
jgi:TolB-like protein/cytochrome c-type biogenesis protein CcmH/NrfG